MALIYDMNVVWREVTLKNYQQLRKCATRWRPTANCGLKGRWRHLVLVLKWTSLSRRNHLDIIISHAQENWKQKSTIFSFSLVTFWIQLFAYQLSESYYCQHETEMKITKLSLTSNGEEACFALQLQLDLVHK